MAKRILGEPATDPQPGVPYRVPYYNSGNKGHLVHRDDPTVFWCGRTVWPEPSALDLAGIERWELFTDGRKNPQVCGDCSKREKAWTQAEPLRAAQRAKATTQFFEHTVDLDDVPLIARQWRMEESWEEVS